MKESCFQVTPFAWVNWLKWRKNDSKKSERVFFPLFWLKIKWEDEITRRIFQLSSVMKWQQISSLLHQHECKPYFICNLSHVPAHLELAFLLTKKTSWNVIAVDSYRIPPSDFFLLNEKYCWSLFHPYKMETGNKSWGLF